MYSDVIVVSCDILHGGLVVPCDVIVVSCDILHGGLVVTCDVIVVTYISVYIIHFVCKKNLSVLSSV